MKEGDAEAYGEALAFRARMRNFLILAFTNGGCVGTNVGVSWCVVTQDITFKD